MKVRLSLYLSLFVRERTDAIDDSVSAVNTERTLLFCLTNEFLEKGLKSNPVIPQNNVNY